MLEADTIKQVNVKEKIRKSISDKRENFSRPNSFILKEEPPLKWPFDHQVYTNKKLWQRTGKNLQATILFVDLTKAFDSIHRGKMEQILLAYGVPKETVAAIMILYRNTKVKVLSPDGDTEYFNIVAGVQAPYLFIICLDYLLRTSLDKIKENGFELTKKRS